MGSVETSLPFNNTPYLKTVCWTCKILHVPKASIFGGTFCRKGVSVFRVHNPCRAGAGCFLAILHSCCRNSESLNPWCTKGLVLHSSQAPARHSPKKHAGLTAGLPLSAGHWGWGWVAGLGLWAGGRPLLRNDALRGGRRPLGERMLFGGKDSFCGGGTLGKTMPFEEENFPGKGCLLRWGMPFSEPDALCRGGCPLQESTTFENDML